jgi:hypothetical protein
MSLKPFNYFEKVHKKSDLILGIIILTQLTENGCGSNTIFFLYEEAWIGPLRHLGVKPPPSPLIVLSIEWRVVVKFSRRTSISFKHMFL